MSSDPVRNKLATQTLMTQGNDLTLESSSNGCDTLAKKMVDANSANKVSAEMINAQKIDYSLNGSSKITKENELLFGCYFFVNEAGSEELLLKDNVEIAAIYCENSLERCDYAVYQRLADSNFAQFSGETATKRVSIVVHSKSRWKIRDVFPHNVFLCAVILEDTKSDNIVHAVAFYLRTGKDISRLILEQIARHDRMIRSKLSKVLQCFMGILPIQAQKRKQFWLQSMETSFFLSRALDLKLHHQKMCKQKNIMTYYCNSFNAPDILVSDHLNSSVFKLNPIRSKRLRLVLFEEEIMEEKLSKAIALLMDGNNYEIPEASFLPRHDTMPVASSMSVRFGLPDIVDTSQVKIQIHQSDTNLRDSYLYIPETNLSSPNARIEDTNCAVANIPFSHPSTIPHLQIGFGYVHNEDNAECMLLDNSIDVAAISANYCNLDKADRQYDHFGDCQFDPFRNGQETKRVSIFVRKNSHWIMTESHSSHVFLCGANIMDIRTSWQVHLMAFRIPTGLSIYKTLCRNVADHILRVRRKYPHLAIVMLGVLPYSRIAGRDSQKLWRKGIVLATLLAESFNFRIVHEKLGGKRNKNMLIAFVSKDQRAVLSMESVDFSSISMPMAARLAFPVINELLEKKFNTMLDHSFDLLIANDETYPMTSYDSMLKSEEHIAKRIEPVKTKKGKEKCPNQPDAAEADLSDQIAAKQAYKTERNRRRRHMQTRGADYKYTVNLCLFDNEAGSESFLLEKNMDICAIFSKNALKNGKYQHYQRVTCSNFGNFLPKRVSLAFHENSNISVFDCYPHNIFFCAANMAEGSRNRFQLLTFYFPEEISVAVLIAKQISDHILQTKRVFPHMNIIMIGVLSRKNADGKDISEELCNILDLFSGIFDFSIADQKTISDELMLVIMGPRKKPPVWLKSEAENHWLIRPFSLTTAIVRSLKLCDEKAFRDRMHKAISSVIVGETFEMPSYESQAVILHKIGREKRKSIAPELILKYGLPKTTHIDRLPSSSKKRGISIIVCGNFDQNRAENVQSNVVQSNTDHSEISTLKRGTSIACENSEESRTENVQLNSAWKATPPKPVPVKETNIAGKIVGQLQPASVSLGFLSMTTPNTVAALFDLAREHADVTVIFSQKIENCKVWGEDCIVGTATDVEPPRGVFIIFRPKSAWLVTTRFPYRNNFLCGCNVVHVATGVQLHLMAYHHRDPQDMEVHGRAVTMVYHILRIKREFPSIPIVIMAALDVHDDILQSGITAFLTQVFDLRTACVKSLKNSMMTMLTPTHAADVNDVAPSKWGFVVNVPITNPAPVVITFEAEEHFKTQFLENIAEIVGNEPYEIPTYNSLISFSAPNVNPHAKRMMQEQNCSAHAFELPPEAEKYHTVAQSSTFSTQDISETAEENYPSLKSVAFDAKASSTATKKRKRKIEINILSQKEVLAGNPLTKKRKFETEQDNTALKSDYNAIKTSISKDKNLAKNKDGTDAVMFPDSSHDAMSSKMSIPLRSPTSVASSLLTPPAPIGMPNLVNPPLGPFGADFLPAVDPYLFWLQQSALFGFPNPAAFYSQQLSPITAQLLANNPNIMQFNNSITNNAESDRYSPGNDNTYQNRNERNDEWRHNAPQWGDQRYNSPGSYDNTNRDRNQSHLSPRNYEEMWRHGDRRIPPLIGHEEVSPVRDRRSCDSMSPQRSGYEQVNRDKVRRGASPRRHYERVDRDASHRRHYDEVLQDRDRRRLSSGRYRERMNEDRSQADSYSHGHQERHRYRSSAQHQPSRILR